MLVVTAVYQMVVPFGRPLYFLRATSRAPMNCPVHQVLVDRGELRDRRGQAPLEFRRHGRTDSPTIVTPSRNSTGSAVRSGTLTEVDDGLQLRGAGLKALLPGIDTITPGGRLSFQMLAAIAEFEHDLIVERTQGGLAAARARGRTVAAGIR
jgi:hypothetical protein